MYRYKLQDALEVNHQQEEELDKWTTAEYAHMWSLLANHTLEPKQAKVILQGMVEETLFDLLNLHQGTFIFQMGNAFAPRLTTLEISTSTAKALKQVQHWKKFHPHIKFPSQCFTISDNTELKKALPDATYQNLYRWANGNTTLRQLGRYLNRDMFTIAKAIYPYVQKGWIAINDYPQDRLSGENGDHQELEEPTVIKPHVVCIDDDLTIGKAVELMLESQPYEMTILNDPMKALSTIFAINPDLILCDIAMPGLDGYELCSMLRNSTQFKQTPIVMLTGKSAYLDRIKARMLGATDYLTKPFGESELITLIERYLNNFNDEM